MVYRTSTTPGRALVHVEPSAPDRLPEGLPAPASAPTPEAPGARDPNTGRLLAGSGASELARRAATKRWERERNRVRLLESLGLQDMPPEAMHKYLLDADQFAKHEVERLAQTVGGGMCGAGPASMVQSAALQLASSRYLFAMGEPSSLGLAARMANDARQNLLCAHELCAREARARAAAAPAGSRIGAILERINQGAK